MRRDLHEANRISWNAATIKHNSHKGDQAAFFREGGTTLFPEEIALLADLTGKRLVHLQCNAGQDTLSIARLGAEVTGVDISDEAITFATQLSIDSGIPATFIRADVYDWLSEAPDATYDIVFCSYGALCWLSDLARWARAVARILKPGGQLVIMEFHPFVGMVDEGWVLKFPYSTAGGFLSWDEGIEDYVENSDGGLLPEEMTSESTAPSTEKYVNPNACYEWVHSLADIFTALLDAGLHIEKFEEYPFTNGWKPLPDMVALEGRRWAPPPPHTWLPLMYGIRAMHPR